MARRKRATIGMNPLDRLGNPSKGKSKKKLPHAEIQAEIRDVLKTRPRRENPVTQWFKSVLDRLT